MRETPNPQRIFSVSDLNREIRALLEYSFPSIVVEGEISNLAVPRSGHFYFSLKDDQAQIRCAMFRNRNMYLRFKPENGQQVLVRGQLSLYTERGEFQLIAEHMEPAGQGDLQQQFEQLKARLSAEGMFDVARKKTLPDFPHQIGVITSATGAALRDILSVLKRRCPLIPVRIYPVAVQGKEAAPNIVEALAAVERDKLCDVVILARGGGSIEDLWPFNEEIVARAMHQCSVPIVSGVGHETDVTIADFVADVRAPTPSGAAELVSPSLETLSRQVEQQHNRLQRQIRRQLQDAAQHLDHMHRRLQARAPKHQLQQKSEKLIGLQEKLQQSMRACLQNAQWQHERAQTKLERRNPQQTIGLQQQCVVQAQKRLHELVVHRLETQRTRYQGLISTLNALSPLHVLSRGYTIITNEQGIPITHAAQLNPGNRITGRMQDGEFSAVIEEQRLLNDPS